MLALVAAGWLGLPTVVNGIGGRLVFLGVFVFTSNTLLGIREYNRHSIGRVVLESFDPRDQSAGTSEPAAKK